jgi:putative protein kinase ArgK-like GTPase of G3E family
MSVDIKEVSFRRKFNLGNYETFDVELVATVGPGQTAADVFHTLDKMTIQLRNERKEAK